MEERIRILYAEDDPVIAELNRDMLEREGYVVDVVYNGEDAWENTVKRLTICFCWTLSCLEKAVLNCCRRSGQKIRQCLW